MDCRPPGSSIHGMSQARIQSGLPFPSPGNLPDPGIEPGSPALQVHNKGSVNVSYFLPSLMGNFVNFSNIVFVVCDSFLKFSPCRLCTVSKYIEGRNHEALTKMFFLMNKELKIKNIYHSAKSHYGF